MHSFRDWSPLQDPFFKDRHVIAFDLDDTLTEKGVLPAAVHSALEEAQQKNWITLLVTGRPAGWADALIKLLPFDGIVAENGALLFFWPHGKAKRAPREECRKLFWTAQGYASTPPPDIRARHAEAQTQILNAVPGTRVASDQPYRLYDLAIDFAEEVDPPLSLDEAYRIQRIFESLGATAKVSSIHVNGWWGQFSKAEGLRELLERTWKKSFVKNLIYVGDSPNDGPLFAAGPLGVGVANVRHFQNQPDFTLPQYVTDAESSQGCLEILARLPVR